MAVVSNINLSDAGVAISAGRCLDYQWVEFNYDTFMHEQVFSKTDLYLFSVTCYNQVGKHDESVCNHMEMYIWLKENLLTPKKQR